MEGHAFTYSDGLTWPIGVYIFPSSHCMGSRYDQLIGQTLVGEGVGAIYQCSKKG